MDELTHLSLTTLGRLPRAVRVPGYDRARLSPGIVHIGLGNFHRAHQAWYTHRLMAQGLAQDWAILGAGVRPADAAMRARLLAQDCLTTLIELDPSGISAEVTGAMTGFLPVEADNAALIAQMAAPQTRIVSLTVTEGGYYALPGGAGPDLAHPDLAHDARHPDRARTAFGAMVAALARRRAAGLGPFTGLSCDNLQGNGAILRRTLIDLAHASDPALADWIAQHASFPDGMVDCIVPATGAREIALAHSFGIDDRAPVTHENFRQWVIADAFCAGRPEWEQAGVTFTADVHAYEAMKLGILNGGHQVICGAGELLGLGTIAACMADPGILALFRRVALDEIAPHVAPVPGMTAADYAGLIERRFANPEIADTTRRVAFDGSSRHAGFVVPAIRAGLTQGTPVEGLALASAIWARYALGRTEDGTPIAPNDPQWPALQAVARAAESRPQAWLEQRAIYGDLAAAPRFATAFAAWYRRLAASGVAATLRAYATGHAPDTAA